MNKCKIAVIGLGYVGLPLSSLLAIKYNVIGFDVDKLKIRGLLENKLPVDEPDLEYYLEKSISSNHLIITNEAYKIKEANIKIITVGTPYNNNEMKIDTEQLISALNIVLPYLNNGDVIILKSTVPPGTTNGLVKTIIENGGFAVPENIGLVFAPERMIEGQAIKDFKTLPKIIGATDERSYRIASEVLSSLGGKLIKVSNPETAEMIKMVDNYSRYVFLALTNEIALISERVGVDVLELIEAAKDNYPRNSGLLLPGPGVGGSCLNKDPFILKTEMNKSNLQLKMVNCSEEINNYMPLHVAELVKKYLLPGSMITILGVAFKGDTNDTRFTPCYTIENNLSGSGYNIRLSDPFVKGEKIISNPYNAVRKSDTIVLLTDHSLYKNLDLYKIKGLMNNKPIIIDCRGLIDRQKAESVGFEYHGVGRL